MLNLIFKEMKSTNLPETGQTKPSLVNYDMDTWQYRAIQFFNGDALLCILNYGFNLNNTGLFLTNVAFIYLACNRLVREFCTGKP